MIESWRGCHKATTTTFIKVARLGRHAFCIFVGKSTTAPYATLFFEMHKLWSSFSRYSIGSTNSIRSFLGSNLGRSF